MMTVTAIVAARGGSVRLPGKALLPFPRGAQQRA
jgi:spore coat polysaccharide biosynthesis protein SpsF (cytidylyltransferase family)